MEDGKFIFAASGEFHPFSYMDGNQMSGFDIDVGNAISESAEFINDFFGLASNSA